jgi:SPP1 family phage portal protein
LAINIREIKLLSEQRFDDEANKVYKVPVDRLPKRQMLETATDETVEVIDFQHEKTVEAVKQFVEHHKKKQVPRLKELKRYVDGDNNIKYRPSKAKNRADNRIANPFARFIIDFKKGVLLSNPLKYTGDKKIIELVEETTKRMNDNMHNNLMAEDTFAYGRAFELIGRETNGKEYYVKLPAEETFVVYDTSHKQNSVAGVHYYGVEFLGETTQHIDVYANDGFTYRFKKTEEDDDFALIETGPEPNYFNAVQVNEWMNNEDRISDIELILDKIDAYDLSQSELANFMQDMSEALLVLEGNPDTFRKKDGSIDTEGMDYTVKNRILVMGDRKMYYDEESGEKIGEGAAPKAYYLKKEYDTQGVEAYNDRTVADMLRFTNLIDFTDENMGGNQSGIGFRFKGWGSDNDRMNKERMITKAIMRRLRLLAHSWNIKENINEDRGLMDSIKSILNPSEAKAEQEEQLYQLVNDIQIKFTPNVPQSDEEIMKVITGMDTVVSDQTIFEMASRLTGISPEEEQKRIKKQDKDAQRVSGTPEAFNHTHEESEEGDS